MTLSANSGADLAGAAKVVAYVRERLVAGDLKQGDRLPPERELCNLVGVSRSTLREGLRALVALGFLDAQQGRGTFIGQPDISVLSDALVFSLAQESNPIEDVLQARIAIECQAVRLACIAISDGELSELNQKLESLVDTLENPECGGAADHAFHLALVVASRSPTLTTLYHAIAPLLLRSHVERRRLAAPDPEVTAFLVQAHREIFVALVNGDPDEAERRVRDHFELSARLRRSRFLKTMVREHPAEIAD